jgi:transcriptional repressor NF-X1
MNREKRQFVHEYSDHFGVTTESFDCEPKRNVVATALKDKSWLPSQSINEVVQNARKALGPVTLTSKSGSFFG